MEMETRFVMMVILYGPGLFVMLPCGNFTEHP
jgi:hypothetical protein